MPLENQLLLQLLAQLLHLLNDQVTMLELLFNYLQFLWICKGILRLDYLLQLMTKSRTLLDIELHLHFHLLLARASNVSSQSLNLLIAFGALYIKFTDFSFQIHDEVSLRASSNLCLHRQPVTGLLLIHQFVYLLLLFGKLALNHLYTRLQPSVLSYQVV